MVRTNRWFFPARYYFEIRNNGKSNRKMLKTEMEQRPLIHVHLTCIWIKTLTITKKLSIWIKNNEKIIEITIYKETNFWILERINWRVVPVSFINKKLLNNLENKTGKTKNKNKSIWIKNRSGNRPLIQTILWHVKC